MILFLIFKIPNKRIEWLTVFHDFSRKWNFSMCVGSIDGKHNSFGSRTKWKYVYKWFFSIVVLAVADANYNFIYFYVGCQGRISDNGVFKYTMLLGKINNGTLGFPQPTSLPGKENPVPLMFVADDAYPLSKFDEAIPWLQQPIIITC